MNNKKYLYIVSGIPGSGKTTWLNNNVPKSNVVLHRDDFRASLRKHYNTKEYYPCSSKEEEFNKWIDYISLALSIDNSNTFYIDQTTLTNKSAVNFIKAIDKKHSLKGWNIIFLVFKVDLKVCLDRNSNRKGYSFVPTERIKEMHKIFNLNENLINKMPDSLKKNVKIKYLKN